MITSMGAKQSFLTKKQVLELTGLHPLALWRMEKERRFPRRHRSTVGRVRWKRAKVEEWIMGVEAQVKRDLLFNGVKWVKHGEWIMVLSPPGLIFRSNTQEWHSRHYRFWESVANDQPWTRLTQCLRHPFCPDCKDNARMIADETE